MAEPSVFSEVERLSPVEQDKLFSKLAKLLDERRSAEKKQKAVAALEGTEFKGLCRDVTRLAQELPGLKSSIRDTRTRTLELSLKIKPRAELNVSVSNFVKFIVEEGFDIDDFAYEYAPSIKVEIKGKPLKGERQLAEDIQIFLSDELDLIGREPENYALLPELADFVSKCLDLRRQFEEFLSTNEIEVDVTGRVRQAFQAGLAKAKGK